MSFLSELKRRNVIGVELFYLVSAWLLVQVTETVLPEWSAQRQQRIASRS